MARQLSEINTSGELTGIKLGGTATEKSVATQEYVNQPRTVVPFTPQVVPPTHLEGQVFYDEPTHSFSIHSDIVNVALNVGQEQYMRIINKTGSTILNGKACRQNGVDVATNLPQVALAIANTIDNSRILGVATHNILNGAEGFITTFGRVGDLDTTAHTLGLAIYLSDTVAGDYTNVKPDIVTQVGGTVVSDLTTGAIQVSILNHIALPTLFGILQDVPDIYSLPGNITWEDINNYQMSQGTVLSVNPTTGLITLPNDGWYRLNFSTSVTVASASLEGNVVLFRLWNDTQSTVLATTQLDVDSGKLTESRSTSNPILVVAGDEVVMQIGSEDSSSNLVFDSVSFDITSITIT